MVKIVGWTLNILHRDEVVILNLRLTDVFSLNALMCKPIEKYWCTSRQ